MVRLQNFRRPTVGNFGVISGAASIAVALVILVLFSACTPPGAPMSRADFLEQQMATGYQAPDGKSHTGASGDKELDRVKDQIAGQNSDIEALSKIDRDLATRILTAKVETASAAVTRVHITFRDSSRLTFDFTDKEIAPKSSKDAGNEVRYKSVVGKTGDGTKSDFEVAMLCRKTPTETGKPAAPGCQMATIALKETAPNGAKAGLVLRNQEVIVLAKTTFTNMKHEILKRLVGELKTAKNGTLQTFEVAWGPSGFALGFGDAQVCPVGRLVETNDLDEPLRLNCAGTEVFRDLAGQMIGNTTRGELLLQITAATPGMIYGETVEHIFMLVRRKPVPKKVTPSTPVTPGTAPKTPGTPGTAAPGTTTPPAAGTAPTEVEDDDDGAVDAVFSTEGPQDEVPPVKLPESAGWLIPIQTKHPFAKTFASDRKNPIIARGVKDWLNGKRLKSFAVNFIPNRNLVFNKLAMSNVPPEFALIMFGESEFFINSGYPLAGPKTTSAWGPWQFIDQTATGNGLRIHRRLVNKKYIAGNPCDERADLAKSSEAAGRYIRSIIDMFPNDPKLVLLGYNQGEYGVRGQVTSLKNTGSKERLAAIKEIGLNYWTIKRFNMASVHGMKYVENFVSVYHAALESDPVKVDPTVQPWKPNPQCRRF